MALIGTVAGTALLVGAKLGTPVPGDPSAAAMDAPGSGPSADGSGQPDAGSAAGSAAPAPGAPGTPASPGPGGSSGVPAPTGAGRTTPPAPPPTKPAPGGLKSGSFTGAGAPAKKYEVVTVTISVSGGKVTVATGSCGSASGESKSICQGAMPKLQQETLAAQNASIATVSGATYTSNAYKMSLQSALDQAKA
ncbi:MAG: hypothetical protein AUI14_18985 [Actinobacteria bacterium 13_2_20CM_2_71_6]|nr:MAG: hypothetical protein AUI14_18985 [Actinobacteria bacterium 13_2_20CM_2_71_6]